MFTLKGATSVVMYHRAKSHRNRSADGVKILWNVDGFGLFRGSVDHKKNIEQQPSSWK